MRVCVCLIFFGCVHSQNAACGRIVWIVWLMIIAAGQPCTPERESHSAGRDPARVRSQCSSAVQLPTTQSVSLQAAAADTSTDTLQSKQPAKRTGTSTTARASRKYESLATDCNLDGNYDCFYTHAQPFNGLRSGTTLVGWYHKKHSPTHTHPDYRTSFIIFLHLQRSMASSLFSLRAWQSSRTTSLQVLFGLVCTTYTLSQKACPFCFFE